MRGFAVSAGSLILGFGPVLAQAAAADSKFEVASAHVSGGLKRPA
jgi:hypothetical protein